MYLWLKAAHVASVLLFVGGTFALLLACAALGTRRLGDVDAASSLRAAVRWWDARVTLPAMVAALGFGLSVAVSGGWFTSAWLQVKLLLVVLLAGLHGVLAGRLRRLDLEAVPAAAKPAPLLVALTLVSVLGIVVLAIIKPG